MKNKVTIVVEGNVAIGHWQLPVNMVTRRMCTSCGEKGQPKYTRKCLACDNKTMLTYREEQKPDFSLDPISKASIAQLLNVPAHLIDTQ